MYVNTPPFVIQKGHLQIRTPDSFNQNTDSLKLESTGPN